MLRAGALGCIGLGLINVACIPAALAQSNDSASNSTTKVDATPESSTAPVPTTSATPATPVAPAAPPAASSGSSNGAEYDAVLGWKGWNIPFPSFLRTILQDKGGFRTKMAEHGLGLFVMNDLLFSTNLYDEPRSGPVHNPFLNTNQTYNGQKPTTSDSLQFFLTYDLGRLGIPNGQLQYQQSVACSTYQGYIPCLGSLAALSYYQTTADKSLEMRVGVYALQFDFAGAFVAGNLSNSLGPGSQPLTLLGVSAAQAVTPAARLKWNINKSTYVQGAVARSLAQGGPSGNLYYDTVRNVSRNLGWSGNYDQTRELYIGEAGYRVPAGKDQMSTWLRMGAVYNNSYFTDFSKFGVPGAAKKSGNSAFYALFDRQIFQSAPDGFTARGLYLGGAATIADPKMTAIARSFDARVYWIGPFDSRPGDVASIVAGYQVNSKHLINAVNAYSNVSGTYGAKDSKSLTVAYLASLATGVYGRVSLNYLSNPGVTYFGPSAANPDQPFMGKGLLLGMQLSTHF